MGDDDEQALTTLQHAVRLDPLSPAAHHNLLDFYLGRKRYNEALATGEDVLALHPGIPFSRLLMSTALLMKGDAEAALNLIEDEPLEVAKLTGQALALWTQSGGAFAD